MRRPRVHALRTTLGLAVGVVLGGPVVLLGALALGGCGRTEGPAAGGGGVRSAPVDRTTPDATWKGAHTALTVGDLAGLRAYLTEAGLRRVVRDLAAWRAIVVDPAQGPRVVPRIRLPDDPVARAAAEADLRGEDPHGTLRVYVGADPRPAWAPLPAHDATQDAFDVELPTAGGETRPARFVRTPDGWRIDRLGL